MRTLLALPLLSLVLLAAAVPAPAPVDEGAQATIFRGDTAIFWFDGNGTPVFIPDANVQIVVTNNANGVVNVRGHGTLPDGAALPSRAMRFDNANTGFFCGFGGTVDFSGVTSPSGQFSFTCKSS